MIVVHRDIERSVSHAALSRWPSLQTYRVAKQAFFRHLLRIGMTSAKNLVAALTSHMAVQITTRRLDILLSDFYRSCGDRVDVEAIVHVLCDCSELPMRRMIAYEMYKVLS